MLEVRHLTKRYRGIPAVSDVSFQLERGEILGYVGPNGSGKSTTVKMLTGLLEPTAGQILFAGRPIGDDLVGFKRRLGFNVETAWRANQASYYGYESYRPILTDFNALFQPKLGKRMGLDLMGGIGVASTRFYVPFATSCSFFSGCINYTSSNHFMEHVGGGIRYYVWHHFFVRPEVHYYHIQNNDNEFYSDSVVRVGGSIGYTIGPE